PSPRFRRTIGPWAGFHFDPAGKALTAEEWGRRRDEFMPSEADRAHVTSLMRRVVEPGKIAGWIAPPERGINAQPLDYEYVRL
ncbi:MAG: benzoyl-CoA 2,3-epoxidase subunit BoxB, partial [Rhodospirillaceae bacterium]|nr:benzoyl-CoA 2,3-epoxidase subunit BoxB [Rhodospirillaceae bacterium]